MFHSPLLTTLQFVISLSLQAAATLIFAFEFQISDFHSIVLR